MASVVGSYARAFADVVIAKKLDPVRVQQDLHTVQGLIAGNAQLRSVMENPSIPGEGKRGVLDGIAKRLGMAREARNFVAVITDHRRLPLLADILKQTELEINERLGITEAEVLSARELGESERKQIEADIARLTGKKVHARYEKDESLLGGAVVKVGSTIYDGSVKGQLEKIREQLVGN
jgi:F-type H+-transporting ATPase subunit delta